MKIEREKILPFKFESKMRNWTPDDKYERTFKLLRRTPGLDMAVVSTKALIASGQTPLSRGEAYLLDVMGTLTVYVKLVENGKASDDSSWIDEILDQDCLFAIHQAWMEYQNSFYPALEVKSDSGEDKATV